ncbi:hypothetical protein IA539_22755 [Gordonia sp. zg691]|uniref:hypothetical protein n=1 Tax=Gordonia jinghuaiqii TaxID=2758710 RepID=UPI0016626F0C|nr:hypothetical protein [Gordonia jinghuaiqii]MBD0863996.1 hypothetical protein [Gordonia jinghuaiqii]
MAPERNGKKQKRRPTPKVAGRTAETRTPAEDTPVDAPPSKPETGKPETSKPETGTPETSKPETGEPETSKVSITKPKRPVSRVSTLRRGDPAPSGPDGTSPHGMSESAPATERRRGRRGSGLGSLTRILAAAAVVLGIVAAILAFHPGASIGPNKAFVDKQATSQLTSQAQDRICAVFGYDHTELDAWQKRAQDALTGQARTEFDETLKAQRDLITQTKTGAECRVDAIGVKDLSGADDGARATVIANLVVSETQNSMATNSGAPRAQFTLVREGEQWRIEAVEPF